MTISLRKPDDFHIHLRQDDMLPFTLKHAANNFGRVLVMPNVVPPLTHTSDVIKYYNDIQHHLQKNNWQLQCLMTLYLTEETRVDDIIEAKESGIIYACKLYPKHGTTNANFGVNMNKIDSLFKVFEKMSELSIILCIHGELNTHDIDIFDRECKFVSNVLPEIIHKFPNLKVILEHITTKESVDFVKSESKNVAATITPQHLLCNRNHIFEGGIRPHYYCLPILKRREDQEALIEAATSGNEKFFIGTDSAPHTKDKKETSCGCAGCFTGYNPVELYLEVFEQYDKLDNIENFVSINGANFYNIPISQEYVNYEKKSSFIPNAFEVDSQHTVVPFLSGKNTTYTKVCNL